MFVLFSKLCFKVLGKLIVNIGETHNLSREDQIVPILHTAIPKSDNKSGIWVMLLISNNAIAVTYRHKYRLNIPLREQFIIR